MYLSKISAFLLGLLVAQFAYGEVVYDEGVGGPLPSSLSNIPLVEIQNATINLILGLNQVVGESESGESFLVSVPSNYFLQSVGVIYNNHIDSNDHVLSFEEIFPLSMSYPYVNTKSRILDTVSAMPNIRNYTFNFDFAAENISEGLFSIYSGTSVQGIVPGNSFMITFEVVDELKINEFDILQLLPSIISSIGKRHEN